ncbi:zinc finger protein 574 [Astyanax mexicanus]|uniref:zinc finger protein 574 n=1 Tax=Astyanax mexicanus TaxID=7994 RepID=UPI0020CB6706|nr:zinc finger protein 574 [Astyanax mexicanus]
MEGSSVYMCFPCYREFPTLEEVLTHQLTCTAENTGPPPAGTLVDSTAGISELAVSEVEERILREQETLLSSADAPRVLYQCAECELLFDALSLWQQHRKMGCFQETRPDPIVEQQQPPDQEEGEDTGQTVQGETVGADSVKHDVIMENSAEGMAEVIESKPAEAQEAETTQHHVSQSISKQPVPEASKRVVPKVESEEEDSPPVRRRGQKKPKPPSSLLCVECGQSFSLVSELVSHRKVAHDLTDAIHRCTVCGEGFINTTLFLYHRKQHRAQVEEEQKELPPPVPQLNNALLETPGEGLLLLATAGEGQSLLEITSLEQTVSDGVPVAQVEVELDPENMKGEEGQQSGQVSEETMTEVHEEMVIEGIVNMEVHEQVGEEVCTKHEAVEQNQVDAEASDAQEAQKDSTPPSSGSGGQSFLCSQCGSSFKQEYELVDHRSTAHGLEGALHTCIECGEEFMSTTKFLYHRKEHHRNGSTGLATSPAARLSQIFTSPGKQRDIILLRRSEPGHSQTSAETTNPQPETNIEAPAKLTRDWSRTPLPHKCPHCGRGFTRRSLLREHVFHHTGEKLFGCHICKKSFPSPASLLRHSMTHGASRAFSCPICAKGFYQPTSLKRHMLTHDEGDRRMRTSGKMRSRSVGDGRLHPCPDCPASFKLDSQLQTHRLLHTSHPFPCNVCGEAFKRRKELDLHSLMHQDKEPKSCPQCGSQFLNQSVLDLHLQRCSGEPPQPRRYKGHGRGRVGGQLECDMCGHRCVTQDGLDLHRLSHTGQTPLRCPLTPCRRRFASSTALAEHVYAHCRGNMGKRSAPRRYACEFCGKEFAYASTFAVHMRTHTDERPFECSQCGKRFRQLPHLQDHERIHSGERPFTCWVCGKSFSVAARLTEHARVHSGERPYACPRCPTAFRSRPNLDKHLRLHASDPSDPNQGALDQEQAVQTILLVQEAPASPAPASNSAQHIVQEGTLVAESEHGSSVVYLHPNISMPTIPVSSGAVPAISVVAGQEVPHTIEFIIEETV